MAKDSVPTWFFYNFVMGASRFFGKLKDMVTPPQVRLYDMLNGYAQTQILRTAVELGVTDCLQDGPKTLSDLSSAWTQMKRIFID